MRKRGMEQWLDKLGVKELPLSLEDWYTLMTRFAKEDPDGNGKDDTYGFSSSGVDIVFGGFWILSCSGRFRFRSRFYLRDGKMVSANLRGLGNKDALAFFK